MCGQGAVSSRGYAPGHGVCAEDFVAVAGQADLDEEAATAALAAAGGHAKTAIVALLVGVDAAEAAVRLDRARGRVRDALGGT